MIRHDLGIDCRYPEPSYDPEWLRDRLDVETGTKGLFRFDTDGAARLVFVDSDPMHRVQTVRERASDLEIDVSETLAEERSEWK